jgi:hypothetical protein
MQRDPLGYADGMSLYLSTATVNKTDPFGKVPISCQCRKWIDSGGGPSNTGSQVSFTVTVDCSGNGDSCCEAACNGSGGSPTGDGNWNIVDSGPDIGPIDGLHPWDPRLRCEAERRRGSAGPGDDSSHHCWAMCTLVRYFPMRGLHKCEALGGDAVEFLGDMLVLILEGNINVDDMNKDMAAHHKGASCGLKAAAGGPSCDACCGSRPIKPPCPK